jgi:undecaprenyl-diphosphatase
MTIIQGILLGMLQGVAEFLPISSSGHLAVAQHLFGLQDVPLLFDVFLHVATLAAVILYFRRQVWELLCAFGRWITRRPLSDDIRGSSGLTCTDRAGRKTVTAIILATIVTGVIGIIVEKKLNDFPIKAVCGGFVFTAVVLIVSSLIEKKNNSRQNAAQPQEGISWLQALGIGLAQGIGTLPGISRSGSTIAGGLLCGVNRADAGEFSFIVSIPAILGAFILELRDLGSVSSTVGAAPVIAGCAAAFAVGYASLTWLMRIIRKGRLEWFACYLIPAGILGMIFLK